MSLRKLLSLFLLWPFLSAWGHREPLVKIGLCLDHSQGREWTLALFKKSMEENRAELVWEDAKGNPKTQVRQAQDLIRQGVQALVVFPCDPSKETALGKAAHQADLKVIALEQPIPGGTDYLIAFNHVKAGELQARAIVKDCPKGRYLLLDSGVAQERKIRDGWLKVLDPLVQQGDIQLEVPQHAASKFRNIRAVNAILAPNAASAQGAVEALKRTGRAGKVPVAGVGVDLASCQRVLAGSQIMTVYRPGQKLAEETAYLAAKLARKARQFDCAFVEVNNGPDKIPAVLLSPQALETNNLESTVVADHLWKKTDLQKNKNGLPAPT